MMCDHPNREAAMPIVEPGVWCDPCRAAPSGGNVMPPRPLTGRELSEQHRALVEADAPAAFRLRWLLRESELWVSDPPVGLPSVGGTR